MCDLNPSLPSEQTADDRAPENCRSIGKACSFLRGASFADDFETVLAR